MESEGGMRYELVRYAVAGMKTAPPAYALRVLDIGHVTPPLVDIQGGINDAEPVQLFYSFEDVWAWLNTRALPGSSVEWPGNCY
jgi:hypothetical protein